MPPPARGLLIGTLILVLGGAVFGQLAPRTAAVASPALVPCRQRIPIKVVSSTEKDTLLGALATAYNGAERPAGTTCAKVTIAGVTSGIAEEVLSGNTTDSTITRQLRDETDGAQVWAPSSRLWLQRLALDAPKQLPTGDIAAARSLAESQLVLAMPSALRDQLGWDSKPPTWAAAMAALKSGQVNYAQDNPRYSTSGALATYLTYGAATAGSTGVSLAGFSSGTVTTPAVAGFVQGVQGAARGGFVNDSTDILRSWFNADSLPPKTMLLIQDQMAWGYNNGQYAIHPGQPNLQLVVVQPVKPGTTTPESLVADHPYATLPGTTAQQKLAAQDFYQYVESNWTSFCMAGFHDPAGRPPARSCRPPSMPLSVGTTNLTGRAGFSPLQLPAAAVQKQMVDQWLNLRAPRRILIAMDVSGSMQAQRLADAVTAVKDGISQLRPQDQVEVVQFAGTASFHRAHWTVLPMQPRGSQNPDPALKALDQRPTSAQRQQTGVLTTVNDVYKEMSTRAGQNSATDPNAPLNAVIVLSDGIDEWNGNATAASVCASWKSIPHVPVYTVHYDPEGENYTDARIKQGQANLATLASCTSPQGLAVQSDTSHSLATIFNQVMGAL